MLYFANEILEKDKKINTSEVRRVNAQVVVVDDVYLSKMNSGNVYCELHTFQIHFHVIIKKTFFVIYILDFVGPVFIINAILQYIINKKPCK